MRARGKTIRQLEPAKKRGAPSLGEHARRESIILRVTADERDHWRSLAEQRGQTVSEMIREAVAAIEGGP